MILPMLIEPRKSLLTNVSALILLLSYALFGGYVFLYLEEETYEEKRRLDLNKHYECVDNVIRSRIYDASTALRIIQQCFPQDEEEVVDWNFLNSLLYGFGILTTLGHGKIETKTTPGRLFTVFYGFVGIPITLIILANFGLYLRRLEKVIRLSCCRAWTSRHKSRTLDVSRPDPGADREELSPIILMIVVLLYLILGGLTIPLLNGRFEFVSGLYYCYICFTAIEFGKLIPDNKALIPIVIFYMCIGLALSTMAVELGSVYVKKLYYYGRTANNFASVGIWFGSKRLQVTELLSALSQTIGISADAFNELDLEKLVKDAILVKEGKLDRIPQCYIFLEGIWPPALVPLFIRDGNFPDYVDADEKRSSTRKPFGLISSRKFFYIQQAQDEQEEATGGINNNTPFIDL